jgi:hypothetical protein
MSAIVEIDEINGGGVTTHGVVNFNVGCVDQPNIIISPATAVSVGKNAYTKLHRLHFLDLGEASSISGLKVWLSTVQYKGTSERIKSNLPRPGIEYYYPMTTADVPTAATYTMYTMPVTQPASANLGINGSLTGILTEPGVSDIFKWQLQTDAYIPPGTLGTKEFTFAWTEDYAGGTLPGECTTPRFSSVSGTSVTLNWTGPGGVGVTYQVDRAVDVSTGPYSLVASVGTGTHVSSGLSAGTYWYRVRAANQYGYGPYTTPIGITVAGP